MSFGIDNGQLNEKSRQECFVLGYELAHVEAMLAKPEGFDRPVHSENRDRIADACKNANREFSLAWVPDDSSESWMFLTVAPLGEEGEQGDETAQG